MALRSLDVIDGHASYTFLLRRYDDKDYIYGMDQTDFTDNFIENVKIKLLKNRLYQGILAINLLIGNIVHNIFIKCIGVVFGKLYLFIFNPKILKGTFLAKVERMWKKLTFLKAIVATILQIFLNFFSFISFGVFSQQLNWISGDVERWVIGDCREDINNFTRNHRCLWRSEILATCQQPLYSVEKIKSNTIALDDVADKIRKKIKKIIDFQNEFVSLST